MSVNWTRQEVLFALRRAGTTAAAIGEANGLASTSVYNALERPYPRVHDLIAAAIGVSRETIWPQFYQHDGRRRHLIRRPASAA